MINWTNLLTNALWVIALAMMLAIVSFHSWRASEQKTRLRDQLNSPGAQRGLNIAGILFCISLALTATRGWESALWGGLALAFLWQILSPKFNRTPTLTLAEVKNIAQLARLDLTTKELKTYRGQLSAILDHVAQLNELDTEGIPPTSSVLPQRSALREDVARPGLGASTLAQNAPDWEKDQFKVPPILD